MPTYHRILGAIDLTSNGEEVARLAWQLARVHGASLALIQAVDYQSGYESDHIPFRTPMEMQEILVHTMRQKLDQVAERFVMTTTECHVMVGEPGAVLQTFAYNWQPDLVIAGSDAPHRLNDNWINRLLLRSPIIGSFDRLILQVGQEQTAPVRWFPAFSS